MAVYTAGSQAVTPVAGDVLLALTTAADEIGKLRNVSVDGHAASAGMNQMNVVRSTTNGATPTAQTAAKKSATSPAAYVAVATTFGTQPTTAAAPGVWERALQAFGGSIREYFNPGDEIIIEGATAGSSEISLESTTGTNIVTCHFEFEEI